MFDYRRTHTCGELRKADEDQYVTLSGWVQKRRDHGGLIFVDLRDRFGLTQIVFNPETNPKEHAIAESLRQEWVISIKGKVRLRAEGMANSKLATGEIEVGVLEVHVLSMADTPPFSSLDSDVSEELRLRYRYLDLRSASLTENLLMRHSVMQSTRRFLSENAFLEIHTPLLGKSTPEGARDYLVPSRVHPENFYALPQSPQLFKQLLMISGMDRYFQIATCFRDEDLRKDRQPEFTQIDLEMSFGVPEDLLSLMEALMQRIFKECLEVDLPSSFPRLTYQAAMDRFGTDRPDTRFGMELSILDDIVSGSTFGVFLEAMEKGGVVKGLCVKGGATLSRKQIEGYTQCVQRFGLQGLAWMKMQKGELTSNIVKFFEKPIQKALIERLCVEEGDLIFMAADQVDTVNGSLDALRRQLAHDFNLVHEDHLDFLWITDFPLFSWDAEEKRLDSLHHPFTAPHVEDRHLLEVDPLKVRSYGYDLILNGYEIGGGSQRIHDVKMQRQIFDLLGISKEEQREKFGFFLDALCFGVPPHLGVAFGLDRLLMIMTKSKSLREVIAFPKTQKASDLMLGSPAKVSLAQLRELKLD